jgi:fumarate reductase flavoprotein subunit
MSGTRLFSLGAAAMLAVALFTGCSGNAKTFDVVVVGSGAAGLSAAIEAADAGAKVAVIEKLPMVGGSTLLSGGYVYGTGSSIQKEKGIKDSPEALAQYWSERAEGVVDADQIKLVAEKSGETIDWLVGMGVKFPTLVPTGTSPVARGHQTSDGGVGIITPMKKYADSKNVVFFMETAATKLLTNGKGTVTGVAAKGKDGKGIEFRAKSVVLATGGFDRSPDLEAKLTPDYQTANTFVAVGNTGDGFLMGQAVGAATEGHGGVIGFRAVPGEITFLTDVNSLIFIPSLYVNKEGKRFVNEATDYPIFHQALNKQTDKSSFLIFDAVSFQPALDKAISKGVAFSGDTLDALAAAAGIDAKGLASTVAEYNKFIAKGKDTQFGKTLKGLPPIAKPKFYALKVEAATLGTMTGLKIDLDTHVIDTKGQPIPGLYAAGEIANGGFFNQVYPASGTSIQMSLTFGRIAGKTAALAAKK